MKTTKKLLERLIADIAIKLNLATSKDEAKEKQQDKYLELEYASIYGGYRVVMVGVNNGAHYGAFGENGTETRLKASEMEVKLSGILSGIEVTAKIKEPINYYTTQLIRINTKTEYAPTLKITDSEGNATKSLSLNAESKEALIYWLNKNF